MVMVHGLMVAGLGLVPRFNKIAGSQVGRGAGAFGNRKSNVVHSQAGYLARPSLKAPETQIYFISHRSGAFPVPRVRTVVRGERASRSIVNRTTALWSMVKVHGLMVAGPSIKPKLARCSNRKINEAREHLAIGNQM